MLFLITSVLLTAIVLYLLQKYSRFSRYGVRHLKPWPILGNFGRVVLKIDHLTELIEKTYNTFPEERFVGRFEFIAPVVVIKDIELLKKVAIKDFEHFIDHRILMDRETDPVFGRLLLALKGRDWKDMRSTMSPVFTSSKMRHMLPFMVEVSDEKVLALKKKIKESGVDYIDIDGKDLISRYTNDIIATCAFGLKVNSHAEKDNQFYRMGKELSNLTFIMLLKFSFFSFFPKLMKNLKIRMFPKHVTEYFSDIILETMQEREQKNIYRPDMIHLIMEAKKGKLTHDKTVQNEDAGFATAAESSIGKRNINRVWSDIDFIAQAIGFFIGGFETISSVMAFTLYELALNPHIQEKLVQEIRTNNIKNKGKFDYTSIQKMTYLDMVVTEVLRLWPVAPQVDRLCVKDYNLGKPNDKSSQDYIIHKGEAIDIPIWAFHRDPKFYPNPEKFDPERFSEENKRNINPFAYMPFGIGPRNCIGTRFALCEIKVMIYHLLQQIEILPCEKTCVPPRLSMNSLTIKLKEGYWLRFKIRNSTVN